MEDLRDLTYPERYLSRCARDVFDAVAGGGGAGGGGAGKRNPNKPQFDTMAGLLKEYKAKAGDVKVPLDYTVERDGGKPVRLGRWLRAVTKAAANNKIKADRVAALDAIDGAWRTAVQTD